jgi:hypothetical protein
LTFHPLQLFEGDDSRIEVVLQAEGVEGGLLGRILWERAKLFGFDFPQFGEVPLHPYAKVGDIEANLAVPEVGDRVGLEVVAQNAGVEIQYRHGPCLPGRANPESAP